MQTWQQVYAPIGGSLGLSALVALIPIVFFFLALLFRFMDKWCSFDYLRPMRGVASKKPVSSLSFRPRLMAVPSATQLTGSGETVTSTFSSSLRYSVRPCSCAPPPVSMTPLRKISPASSGGVFSST